MVVPRPIFYRAAIGCGRRVVFLERTLGSQLRSCASAVQPVDPALFSLRHVLTERRLRFPGHTLTPQLTYPGRFRPIFSARNVPEFRAAKPVTRCLTRRTEWSVWNPFGTTGGTPTHSRRTALKLEQLPCARPALVRVPESNTKYGGKLGKPRGRSAP